MVLVWIYKIMKEIKSYTEILQEIDTSNINYEMLLSTKECSGLPSFYVSKDLLPKRKGVRTFFL